MDKIVNALEALAELRAEQVLLAMEYSKKIALLEAMRDGITSEIDERIDQLEKEIKASVKDFGSSVKSSTLHAVFSKPRITWDSKALDGYATGGHPELFAFRKEGKPSCSIRTRR